MWDDDLPLGDLLHQELEASPISEPESSDGELPFDFGLGDDVSPSLQARSSGQPQLGHRPSDLWQGGSGEAAATSSTMSPVALTGSSLRGEGDGAQMQHVGDLQQPRRESDDENHRLREQEDVFWASMTPVDAKKMQSMLQAVSLYQQHLQQNEDTIMDLNSNISNKERTYASSRRRVQQVGQSVAVAKEQGARFEQELERWRCKSEHYEENRVDVIALQAKHMALSEERVRLLPEAELARAELADLQDRLGACEAMSEEQASRYSTQEASCRETIASVQAEHAVELALLRTQFAEELPKWEAELQCRVSELRAQRASEASHLRTALVAAQHHAESQKREREDAIEHLAAQQRESSRLQQQCAEAREEVLDLASQVRMYQDVPRVASQRGISLDGSMASIEFLPLPGEDPQLDMELESVRQSCKALERECQRMHNAFEQKQAECERWRKLALEQRQRQSLSHAGAPEESGALESSESAAPLPFVLGPA